MNQTNSPAVTEAKAASALTFSRMHVGRLRQRFIVQETKPYSGVTSISIRAWSRSNAASSRQLCAGDPKFVLKIACYVSRCIELGRSYK